MMPLLLATIELSSLYKRRLGHSGIAWNVGVSRVNIRDRDYATVALEQQKLL